MALRVTGHAITTTLTIQFTDNEGTVTKFNADSTPTAKVYLGSTLVETISGSSVTNTTTGIYTVTWTPASAGQYKVILTIDGRSFTENFEIISDPRIKELESKNKVTLCIQENNKTNSSNYYIDPKTNSLILENIKRTN